MSSDHLPASRAPHKRKHEFIFYLLCLILLYFYVNAFRSTIIDDAFIQFQYADTLAKSGTWGFYPGQPTNTATSPLNVLLLALFTVPARSPVTGAILLTACLLTLLLMILQKLSLRLFSNSFFGFLLFLAILANPLLLSCLGMEIILFVVLWIACLSLFVHERWRWLAASLALLTLARPDGFLLFLIMVMFSAFSSKQTKEKALFVAIYVLLLIPWHVFAWVHLGSLVPDTLLIKTNQKAWLGNVSFGSGLWNLYFARFPRETILSLLPFPFLFFSFPKSNPDAKCVALIAIGYAILHYAAYSLLRVPPYHWYYAHLALAIAVAGSIGAASLVHHSKQWRYGLLLVPLSALAYVLSTNGFPLREAPIHTNWATHDQYKQAGEWLERNTEDHDLFIMGGEIGTLAYYSKRTLLNNFSNRWTLQRVLNRNLNQKSAWEKSVFAWNFHWRKEGARYPRAAYRIDHVLRPHRTSTDRGIVYSQPTSTKWIPEGVLYVRRTRQQGADPLSPPD